MPVGQKLASCRLLPAWQLRHNRYARNAHGRNCTFKRTNREGHNMAKQDASNEDGSSLEQAQYEYRKTIYFAGLKILETFSEAVIGRDPCDGREPESGGAATAQAAGPPPGPPAGGHIYGPPAGAHIYGPPAGAHIYGPPAGAHIYGPPAGAHIYGPPAGGHIYGPWGGHIYGPPGPPHGCGPQADGPPPGGHIYAIVKLVEVVLSLKPPPK
jgi:hypothetical protein